MGEYQLSDKHRDWLRHDNRLPEARAFREGLEVEALTRKAYIPDHLRDICECVTAMCKARPERTSEQVATSLYYIFHEPPKQNWIQRHTRLWAAILVALAVVLVGIDEGRHSTWPVAIAYMGGVVAGMAATVYFLTPKGKKHGR